MGRRKERKMAERSPWCKRVSIALIQRDMTKKELAEALGKSKQYISSVCSGRIYSESAINMISEFLGISNKY